MLRTTLPGGPSGPAVQSLDGGAPAPVAAGPAHRVGMRQPVSAEPLLPKRNHANPGVAPPSPECAPRTALDWLASLREPDTGTRVVYIGGGPRTTTQVAAEIGFLQDHRADFNAIQAAGGRHNIHSVVIERKDER